MQSATLQELILQSRQNNAQAFRKLVEGHQNLVYSLAYRILYNEDDAKDIVQETFIRVWKHLHRFNPELKFTTWLYTIATNLCYDRLKALKRNKGFQNIGNCTFQYINFQSAENIETAIINSELGEIIKLFTNDLTPKQKLVFTLRDLEGIEVEEIETITGLSAEKIKSNLYLARQFIRRKLEKL
jgi:RNA polymerase sigma-70 factor, ECF subfamily